MMSNPLDEALLGVSAVILVEKEDVLMIFLLSTRSDFRVLLNVQSLLHLNRALELAKGMRGQRRHRG